MTFLRTKSIYESSLRQKEFSRKTENSKSYGMNSAVIALVLNQSISFTSLLFFPLRSPVKKIRYK